MLANKGFLTLVAAHEYAHLRLDHHTKIRTNKGPFMIPNDNDLKAMWGKYVDVYRESFPNISKECFVKQLIRQFMEIEADLNGYKHAVATLYHATRDSSDPFNQSLWFFSQLGMLSFFLSIEYLERTVRTLTYGHDRRENPLFSTDFDIQDVVLRNSHPSPMTRFRWICKTSGGATPTIAKMLEEVLAGLWETIYPTIQQIHKSGTRPHLKWIHPSSEMSCTLVEFGEGGGQA